MRQCRTIGVKVRIAECSGVDSGREGEIVPRSLIETDGRGRPIVTGHYHTMTELGDYMAVRAADGEILLVHRNRLICI